MYSPGSLYDPLGRSTGRTSFQPGFGPMKPLLEGLESASLESLFSELVKRLTALESLGLLSVNGLSVKSLLQKMTPTQSTDGSAANQEGFTTSTYHPVSGPLVQPKELLNSSAVKLTRSASPGRSNQDYTACHMTLGCTPTGAVTK